MKLILHVALFISCAMLWWAAFEIRELRVKVRALSECVAGWHEAVSLAESCTSTLESCLALCGGRDVRR